MDILQVASSQTLKPCTKLYAKFPEHLLQQGARGGAEAAYQLLTKSEDYLAPLEGAKNWKILVRIYVNLEGLIKKCLDVGLLQDEMTLRLFCAGFTESQPLFDIVDAGHGKERADHKIKGSDWILMLAVPR